MSCSWMIICLNPQLCWCWVYNKSTLARRWLARSQLLASVSLFYKESIFYFWILSFFGCFGVFCFGVSKVFRCSYLHLLAPLQSMKSPAMLWQSQHCGCLYPSLASFLIGVSSPGMWSTLFFPNWLFAKWMVFLSIPSEPVPSNPDLKSCV